MTGGTTGFTRVLIYLNSMALLLLVLFVDMHTKRTRVACKMENMFSIKSIQSNYNNILDECDYKYYTFFVDFPFSLFSA